MNSHLNGFQIFNCQARKTASGSALTTDDRKPSTSIIIVGLGWVRQRERQNGIPLPMQGWQEGDPQFRSAIAASPAGERSPASPRSKSNLLCGTGPGCG